MKWSTPTSWAGGECVWRRGVAATYGGGRWRLGNSVVFGHQGRGCRSCAANSPPHVTASRTTPRTAAQPLHLPTPGTRISERQTPSGGLNGRPEKLQDVCYSWWALSALSTLGRLAWVDGAAVTGFILDCQDREGGGISDRPDDAVDVFHTFFGLAGLSLLGHPGLEPIDPVYALPTTTVGRLGLPAQRLRCA